MNYSVRLIEREYRPKYQIWVTRDVYHIVVNARGKPHARKVARREYDDPCRYGLGRISLDDREVGKYIIPIKPIATYGMVWLDLEPIKN